MRAVTVDPSTKTIIVQGGALWVDVDEAAAEHGLATVGGTVNHTGVGGLTLGGGYGFLTGKYGLTIDNLLSVEIVLPSGDLVTASSTQHPDLFWAVRGAGQNFGVVTSFTFQGHDQPNPVYAGTLIFPLEKLPQVVSFVNDFEHTQTGDQVILWGVSCPPPVNAPVVLTQLFHNGSAEEGKSFFAPLLSLEPLVNLATSVPYKTVNSLLNNASGFDGRKQFGGGAFKLPVSLPVVQSLVSSFLDFTTATEETKQSLLLFETVPYREVVKVRNDEMAFSNRGEYYNLAVMLKWTDAERDGEMRDFARGLVRGAGLAEGAVRKEEDGTEDKGKGVGQYGNYASKLLLLSFRLGCSTRFSSPFSGYLWLKSFPLTETRK